VRLEGLAELLRIASTHVDTRQFLDDTALAGEEDEPAPQGHVRLSTVHAAKGLEFRAVYIPGCELGLFPLVGPKAGAGGAVDGGSGGQNPLPGTGEESGPVDDTDFDEGAAALGAGDAGSAHEGRAAAVADADPEERRIFYVAVTRAKESLTLSYCTFRRDARVQPSPYLGEIGRGLLRRARLGSDEPLLPGAGAKQRAPPRAGAAASKARERRPAR
jgi:DNA helicase-2/ATP-dependent DNA helicase PcrA